MSTQRIADFCAAARDYVLRATQLTLDGSETSLAYVDHYLNDLRGKGPIRDEALDLIAPAIGAYFGEVAVAHFGGRWINPDAEPPAWQIEIGTSAAPLRFHPIGMAAAALRLEDVEDYPAHFETITRFSEGLSEALAAAPEVDEAYFYSLTGRLEVLTQALDILAELVRRADHSKPHSEPS